MQRAWSYLTLKGIKMPCHAILENGHFCDNPVSEDQAYCELHKGLSPLENGVFSNDVNLRLFGKATRTDIFEKTSVLIIDDNKKHSSEMKKILKALGCPICNCANDGFDGLNAILMHEYNIIIIDVRLPMLNGFDVLQELYRRKVNSKVIMASSANKDVSDGLRAAKFGACGYITKPVKLSEFIWQLKKTIEMGIPISSYATTFKLEDANAESDLALLKRKVDILEKELATVKSMSELRKYLFRGAAVIISVSVALIASKVGLTTNFYEFILIVIFLSMFLTFPIERLTKLAVKSNELQMSMGTATNENENSSLKQ
jgi:DNA-binding response OmpR family regulator